MSGKDNQVVIECIQLFANRADDLIIISSLKVRTTDAAIEERIATEERIGLVLLVV